MLCKKLVYYTIYLYVGEKTIYICKHYIKLDTGFWVAGLCKDLISWSAEKEV